jgi:hypothetical protein
MTTPAQSVVPPAAAATAAVRPNPTTMTLDELANGIKDKHSKVLFSFQSSVTHAMEVGDWLNAAKIKLKHGDFEPWVQTHCQLSPRTARRYMEMARDRTQIEARLAAKTANLADLNAQQLLTDQSGGGNGEGSGRGNGDNTPAGAYDKLEEQLIKKLKKLRPGQARRHAEKTIGALNDTVEVIESQAADDLAGASKASKLGGVQRPPQS